VQENMPKQDNYISDKIRSLVANRAAFRCEYCLLHEEDSYLGFEIDHIISKKHGGLNLESNLAYSCLNCNRNKGSDIASLTIQTQKLTPLFNPRKEKWSEHFYLQNGYILPKTAVGEVTATILKLNAEDYVTERIALQEIFRYPIN
jgi:hypothetical protein